MPEIRQVISFNVRHYRKLKSLTQQQLAELCGVTTPYVGEIEIGRKYVSMKMVATLSAVLGIKPWQLFVEPEEREYVITRLLEGEVREALHSAINQVGQSSGKQP